MSRWLHELAEARHRILNPLTDDKLKLLVEISRFGPGSQMLDLACGKGELLGQWVAACDGSGRGVDTSEVFLAAARHRMVELGVSDRVGFIHGDAARYAGRVLQADTVEVVSCLGATWIGGGLAGTIPLLRSAARPDALLLIGHPYWIEPPPSGVAEVLQIDGDDTRTLAGTLDVIEAAECELVEMVLADGDSWDRYVATQWWTLTEWLRTHPDDPRTDEVRRFRDDGRRSYLRYGRRYLGWGVFVMHTHRHR